MKSGFSGVAVASLFSLAHRLDVLVLAHDDQDIVERIGVLDQGGDPGAELVGGHDIGLAILVEINNVDFVRPIVREDKDRILELGETIAEDGRSDRDLIAVKVCGPNRDGILARVQLQVCMGHEDARLVGV